MKCEAYSRGKPCAYCDQGRKARRFYKGHYGYRPYCPAKETLTQMIRKQSSSGAVSGAGQPAARDVVMEADRPLLMEYLTQTCFEDGSERETATLLVFAADGVWKVCLNDRAEQSALWASGVDVASALDALEAKLDTQVPDWRKTQRPKLRK